MQNLLGIVGNAKALNTRLCVSAPQMGNIHSAFPQMLTRKSLK